METEEPDAQHGAGIPANTRSLMADQRVVLAWLIEYLKSNPVSVAWQSALVIGGFILTVHFFNISIFPNLDWMV